MTEKYNSIIYFDHEKFSFERLILEVIQKHLFANIPARRLDHLALLHQVVGEADLRQVYECIYRLFTTREFDEIYGALCTEIIQDRFDGAAAYQKIPTVRIQLPGSKSVNFHTDAWYGHGENVQNFWLPLVPVRDNNSMFVIEPAESEELLVTMKADRKSIMEMNELCQHAAAPLEMNLGEIFAFNSRSLHGTVINDTDRTRVSFDFRMLLDGDDPGLKDRSFYIRPGKLTAETGSGVEKPVRGAIYVGQYRGVTRRISQKYQEILCYHYASERRMPTNIAETELCGFEHHPNLQDMLSGTYVGRFEALILFSVQLLPEDLNDRQRLIQEARTRGISLHFVCEDFVWRPGDPVDALENVFQENSECS